MLRNLKEKFFGRKLTEAEAGVEADLDPAASVVPPQVDTAQAAAATAATINLLTTRITRDAAVLAVLGGPAAMRYQPEAVKLAMMLQLKAAVLEQLTGSSQLPTGLVTAVSGKLRGVGDEGTRFVTEMLGADNLAGALVSPEHDPRGIFAIALEKYRQQLLAESNVINQNQE